MKSTAVIHIVDDDRSVRKALATAFKFDGWKTETYESAEEFLDRGLGVGNADIGCVVADVRMPGMGGVGLQAGVAQRGDDVPIIFMSGHGAKDLKDQLLIGGAAGFLSKPFDDEEVIAMVEDALHNHYPQE